MDFVLYILLALGSYLIGCISLSIILSKKVFGGDVRGMGSGNAGATNMARSFGLSAGVITLLADAFKAVIAMVIGNLLFGDLGLAIGGTCALIGHCYPVFYGFKGGKGVSVGVAIAFGIDWKVGLFIVVCFAIVAALTKRVSPSSIAGAVGIIVACIIFEASTPELVMAIVGAALVIYRHKENIKRLIAGTEPEFKAGSGKKKY
ncbi:MAG: glycerol-3-phosphate acyltransferase [Oscillospiraceae bacterium]|nr:glycerol-3-phosphate acyltransferase [Oscillospiraceae bacterium]